MKVTFTRTGARRYRVSVEGPGIVSSAMEPAAGYDSLLPHDMAHFVVENELGIRGGVFGQLAEGGHARTFHPIDLNKRRKFVRHGDRIAAMNRNDADLSEKLVTIVCQIWSGGGTKVLPTRLVSSDDIQRVCRQFDLVSAVWSKLGIGESMTLEWHGSAGRRRRSRSSHF